MPSPGRQRRCRSEQLPAAPAGSRCSRSDLIRQRPPHVIDIHLEGVSHVEHVLARFDVLPQRPRSDPLDRRFPETNVRRHANRRQRIVMRTPANSDVVGPVDSLYEATSTAVSSN